MEIYTSLFLDKMVKVLYNIVSNHIITLCKCKNSKRLNKDNTSKQQCLIKKNQHEK